MQSPNASVRALLYVLAGLAIVMVPLVLLLLTGLWIFAAVWSLAAAAILTHPAVRARVFPSTTDQE